MRLPRDLSGHELIALLRQFGYEPTRQVWQSHTAAVERRGFTHSVTVPDHRSLRLGTLSAILSDVAEYLNVERAELQRQLFEK